MAMVEVTCQQCSAKFEVKPNKLAIGKGKYCSRKCYGLAAAGKPRGAYGARASRVSRVCEECGKKFEVLASQVKAGHGILCSKRCAGVRSGKSSGRAPVQRECVICSAKFETRPDEVDAGRGQYCSHKCWGASRTANSLENKTPFECEACGETFIDTRKNNRQRRFCSNKCRGKSLRKGQKAPAKRSGSEHSKWARSVILRDKECIRCGRRDSLQAHHVKHAEKHPELILDLNNGVALCPPCHHSEHPTYPLSTFISNGGSTVLRCVVCEGPYIPRKSSQRACSHTCSGKLAWARRKTPKGD